MSTPSNKSRFGLSCAISTPFDDGGAIDMTRLIAHARRVRAEGCDSVTLFGTTGEGFSVSLEERVKVIGGFKSAGFDMGREVGVGIMASSVGDAAQQCRQALKVGCRHLLLAPPFYFKGISDDGLFAWHAELFQSLGDSARDVILYHLPGQTAVPLSLDLIGRLKIAFPKVVRGVKDSSGDLAHSERLVAKHGDLAILIGDERHLAPIVRKGGQGAICGLSNIEAKRLRTMIYEGKDDPIVNGLVDVICDFPVLSAIKAMIAHRTGDKGWLRMRAPLDRLDDERAKRLAARCDAVAA
jgi:4-hydroxy-tetrahydrodipicolinate synthase